MIDDLGRESYRTQHNEGFLSSSGAGEYKTINLIL